MKKLTEYQVARNYAPYKAKTKQKMKDTDAIIKVLPLLNPLMEVINEVEPSKMYKQKMKQHGNAFKNELEYSLGVLNGEGEEEEELREMVEKLNKINTLVRNTHISKLDKLISILETFHNVDNADVESYVNDIVSKKYASITNFGISKTIITKLKKIMPMVEDIVILQVSQQISKEQLQNTKGFGDESIKELENVFEAIGIKW